MGKSALTITSNNGKHKCPGIVKWWTIDPTAELELRLTDFAKSRKDFLHPDQTEYIYSIYSGDHGKGKLRFGLKLVLSLVRKESDKEERAMPVYPLADDKCKKDTDEIFKSTVKVNLSKGVNRVVEHGQIKFEKNKENGRWKCTIIDPDHDEFKSESNHIHDGAAFVVGGLKFLSMMLGKGFFWY